SLPQIALTDPDWLFWALEKNVFEGGDLADQARYVSSRAKRIKVPQTGPEPLVVEYVRHCGGLLGDVEVVPASQPAHHNAFRRPWFDLSVPRSIKQSLGRRSAMDKTGAKLVLHQFKLTVFGGKVRITRRTAAQFFEDDHNFVSDGADGVPIGPQS